MIPIKPNSMNIPKKQFAMGVFFKILFIYLFIFYFILVTTIRKTPHSNKLTFWAKIMFFIFFCHDRKTSHSNKPTLWGRNQPRSETMNLPGMIMAKKGVYDVINVRASRVIHLVAGAAWVRQVHRVIDWHTVSLDPVAYDTMKGE